MFSAVTFREMVRELVDYRELLVSLVRRDLLVRYKQAVMGLGWALLMPVANVIIFSAIFTRVARLETDIPYPLYAFVGLLPWSFFASSLRFAVTSLTSNAVLVSKVYFPRELFPLSAVLVCLVDFAIGSLLLVAMMIYYQVGVASTLLFLPVVLAVHLAFTLGMALVISMANLFYRDVKYLFEIVLTLWMFATSVVYPVDRIGGTLGTILSLNPMTPIIEAYRAVLVGGTLPPAGSFGYAAGVAVVLLLLGWATFHRAEHQFAESI